MLPDCVSGAGVCRVVGVDLVTAACAKSEVSRIDGCTADSALFCSKSFIGVLTVRAGRFWSDKAPDIAARFLLAEEVSRKRDNNGVFDKERTCLLRGLDTGDVVGDAEGDTWVASFVLVVGNYAVQNIKHCNMFSIQ